MHHRAFPRDRPDHRGGGQAARIGSVADAIRRYRIGYVSEDRKGEGLVLDAFRARQCRHDALAAPRAGLGLLTGPER